MGDFPHFVFFNNAYHLKIPPNFFCVVIQSNMYDRISYSHEHEIYV